MIGSTRVRRISVAVVGVILAFVMLATLFLSAAIRHTHRGGDEGHSHKMTHADPELHPHSDGHSHSHVHSHSHSDGHSHSHVQSHSHSGGHSHSHDSHSHPDHHRREVTAAHPHVHISFLWFELTLPDFSGGEDEPPAANVQPMNDSGTSVAASETINLTSPFTVAQLVQLLLLTPVPLPERTTILVADDVRFLCPASLVMAGRLPDAPPLPPPEFA